MNSDERIFGMLDNLNVRSSNNIQILRKSNFTVVNNRILAIFEESGRKHPYDFFNMNFNYENDEELAIDLANMENLPEYLESTYKFEEIREDIRENQLNNLSDDQIDEQKI